MSGRGVCFAGWSALALVGIFLVACSGEPPKRPALGRVSSAATFAPVVGTALGHATTGRLDDTSSFPVCQDKTTITPPANGVPPPGPLGPGLSPPLASFEGMNRANSCNCFDATDDSGMVGPNNYVQSTNCAVAVYDRTGALQAGPIATSNVFAAFPTECAGTSTANPGGYSDATVTYDRYADRWIISRFANDTPSTNKGNWNQCFAISQTSDPNGKYDVYAFRISATFFNDYPKMGVWSDAYYMTANANGFFDPTNTGKPNAGNLVTAFERDKMLNGDDDPGTVTFFVPAPALTMDNPQGKVHSHMLPAFVDGPTAPAAGTPNFVVELQDDDFGFDSDQLQMFEAHVDWTAPSSSTLTSTTALPAPAFHSSVCSPSGPFVQVCLPQPGTTNQLDSMSYGYMMQRLVYRVFPDHETLMFNHTISATDGTNGSPHAAIRWYEMRRPTGGDWSIFQQGDHAVAGTNRWMGSLGMDKDGDIALGYVTVSGSLSPSIRYDGRKPGDTAGQLPAGEQTLIAGNGALSGTEEFGDYNELSLDPKDDCTFWITNTYVAGTTTNNEWHTRVGAFKFGSCNNPPVAKCKDTTKPANGMCLGAATAGDVDGGSFDPDGDSFKCTISPAGPFALGPTTVTLTCTDSAGASNSCTATVTVVDQTPPVLTVPPDRTVAICTDAAVIQVGQATATDNCAASPMPTGAVINRNGVPLNPTIPVVNGQVALGTGTYTILWTVSDGVSTVTGDETVTVGASIEAGQSFLIEDRAQIRNGTGGFAAVLNAGPGLTRVGNDARAGAVLSVGPVTILHRAVVGNVTSAATVTKDADATAGTIVSNGVVSLPPLPALPAFPMPALGSFTVNSGTTQSHPAGSYANGTVNGGTLILGAGDYFFQTLTLNSGSTIRATPATRVFVRTTLVFNAPFRAPAGAAIEPLFMGFAGGTLGLNAVFNGTLVAPNATVTFGTGAGLTFTGSFFARTMDVTPASALVCTASP